MSKENSGTDTQISTEFAHHVSAIITGVIFIIIIEIVINNTRAGITRFERWALVCSSIALPLSIFRYITTSKTYGDILGDSRLRKHLIALSNLAFAVAVGLLIWGVTSLLQKIDDIALLSFGVTGVVLMIVLVIFQLDRFKNK